MSIPLRTPSIEEVISHIYRIAPGQAPPSPSLSIHLSSPLRYIYHRSLGALLFATLAPSSPSSLPPHPATPPNPRRIPPVSPLYLGPHRVPKLLLNTIRQLSEEQRVPYYPLRITSSRRHISKTRSRLRLTNSNGIPSSAHPSSL